MYPITQQDELLRVDNLELIEDSTVRLKNGKLIPNFEQHAVD